VQFLGFPNPGCGPGNATGICVKLFPDHLHLQVAMKFVSFTSHIATDWCLLQQNLC